MAEPQQIDQVPPSHVPTVWGTGVAQMADRTTKIMVQIQSPTGVFVTFLDPEQAKALGGQLIADAASAKTGLILPPGAMN